MRPITRAVICARPPAKTEETTAALAAKPAIPVTAAASAEQAVRSANFVATTPPSATPPVTADWLEPGQHLTAMGLDAEHKNEVDPRAVIRADLYVADSLAQTRRLGELHHAIKAGLAATEAAFPEIGAVVAGAAPGQTSAGVQDTAFATVVRKRVLDGGGGSGFQPLAGTGWTTPEYSPAPDDEPLMKDQRHPVWRGRDRPPGQSRHALNGVFHLRGHGRHARTAGRSW